jgi:RNA-directed DNA polymerase
VYTFIAQRPIRSLKTKIRTLSRRLSQQDLGYVLTQLNQVMHGWANYFRYAVSKSTFSMLDNIAWKRVIRMLIARHHWTWSDVRRRFTTATGSWLPISAADVELRPIAAIPVTRYRWRATKIPSPWSSTVSA